MKRRITALLLTVIMVFGMIPMSLLSALAHGTGVAGNDIENLSIQNAPNQAIPATAIIDGKEDDTAWPHDEWQVADAATGIWDAIYYRSTDLSFKYQLHSDYQHLYGIVVLDTNEIYNGTLKDITIWLNSDENVKHYTSKIVLSVAINEGVPSVESKRYSDDGAELSDPNGTLPVDQYLDAVKIDEKGVLTVEFRSLTKTLAGEEMASMTAYVSVGIEYKDGEVQTLYHPRFDAEIDYSTIDPADVWPENATEVTQREIYSLPNADYSKVLPNEMVIDGKVEESVWAPYTTMYSEGLDRYEYRAEDSTARNDATGFDVVDFNTVKYHNVGSWNGNFAGATSGYDCPIKYKYDVRYDANYLYGAVVAYADINVIKNAVSSGTNPILYLTMSVCGLTDDGTAADTSLYSTKQLVITNITKLADDNNTRAGDDWTGMCTYGGKDVSGGSNRVNDYIVEFEFAIPMSMINPQAGKKYGYILCVDTAQWTTGGSHTITYNSGAATEVNAATGYWSGCYGLGNWFTKSSDVNTEAWSANGSLEAGRWTAIKAADNKVDSMSRSASQLSTAFTTEHMAYDVFTDDDYLYGMAVIEDSEWTKASDDTASAFNIWLNNGTPRWEDWYDNKLSFMIDSSNNVRLKLVNHYIPATDFYNGTENMLTGIYDAYSNPSDAIAALRDRGFVFAANKTSFSSNDYAQKWLIHPTEAVNTQGVEAVMKDITESGHTKIILEFKIPLEMLLVTEKVETGNSDFAFTYVASVGHGDGTGGEMAHPMMSNRRVNQSGAGLSEKVFYVNFWNAHESNRVRTEGRYTNNIGDGKLQEYYWDTVDEMIEVNGETGVWENPPVGDEYIDYYYRVYTSREWLYGGAVINDAANPSDTKFTLWYNNDVVDASPSSKATGRMEIYLNQGMEPVCDFYDANGTKIATYTGVISAPSALEGDVTEAVVPFKGTVWRYGMSSDASYPVTQNYGYASMKTLNGETIVEFKLNLDKFIADHEGKGHTKFAFDENDPDYSAEHNIDDYYLEPREKFEFIVSVTHEDNTLYHLGGDDYHLWVTDVNKSTSGITNGGFIINQDFANHIVSDQFSYVLFYPTEMENIYQVKYMNWLSNQSDSGAEALNKWIAEIPNFPEGAFIYKQDGYNLDTYPEYLKWNYNGYADGIFDTIFQEGNYVSFENVNPYGKTLEEVVSRLGNEDVPYELRGYYTGGSFNYFAYPGDDNINSINDPDTTSYPSDKWTFTTDYSITPLQNYVPEDIYIDGYVDDSGWDEDKWIYVSNNVNGNLQNPGDTTTTPEFEYKYQLRNDGEYVYIAAVMDHDPGFTTATNGYQSAPQFRIWIQSEGEEYSDAISFTHLFDVRLGAETDPNTALGFNAVNKETTLTVERYDYADANLPFVPLADANVHEAVYGVDLTDNGSNVDLTYKGVTLRFAEHRSNNEYENGVLKPYWNRPNGGNFQTWVGADNKVASTTTDQTKGFGLNSAFWGETTVVAENTKGGTGNEYVSKDWFASPEVKKYVYANEHAAYNSSKDGTQTIVEFKFALSDIGTDNEKGFKYYVQCSSLGSTTSNAFVLFHPNYTIEPDNGTGAYMGYHLPFWVWGENAFYCDKQWFYDNELNDPENPVTPLGSQYADNYTDGAGKTHDHVLRFGVLYNQEYLDDVYGKTAYDGAENIYKDATYWDVKEIGLVLDISKYIDIDENTNDAILYTDTPYVQNVYSDMIIHHKVDSNMADYENYIFYAIVTIPEAQMESKLTYRGYVEYYPHDDIYYDNTWIEGSKDTQEGYTFRPTYYSGVITRSYDMVKEGAEKYGVNGDNMPDPNKGQTTVEPEKIDMNGVTVAYIPLDDRPVNYQRVQYLAQATGIDLLMPPEKYFTNTLDNDGQGANGDSDSGNPLQLLNWLETDAKDANYYILSLDMLFSGGLIGSRAPEVDTTYDDGESTYIDGIDTYEIGSVNQTTGLYELSAGEQAIMDYLIELAADPSKYVVYFDTVIRLASTTYYGDYTLNDYNALRSGYAEKERVQLYGTDLTVENIIAGYNTDASGNAISNGQSYTYGSYTTNKIAQYNANRQRKLTIIDELLTSKAADGTSTVDNIEMLYIGADDSKPQVTIQTNELRYVEEKLLGNRDNAVVMAAADELGLLGIANVTTEIYGDVNVNVTYYGNGKDYAADDYDRGNLNTTTKAHVKAAGGYFDNNEENPLEILVLTRGDYYDKVEGYSDKDKAEHIRQAKLLLQKAQYNINNNIPTCIIDVANKGGITGTLASYMFGYDFHGIGLSEISNYALSDVGLLLGYSEWNTCANSLGISISNAIARYTYLQNCSDVTEESNYGFMKVHTHGFVKDIAYRQNSTDGAAFYKKAPIVTEKLNQSEIYVGEIGTANSRVEPFTAVKVSELYWPWDRAFEADFTISFLENGMTNIALKKNGASYQTHTNYDGTKRNATLNDGETNSVVAGNSYDTDAWFECGASGRTITFTLKEATELGLVRVHINAAHYSAINDVSRISIYGIDSNGNENLVGEIRPHTEQVMGTSTYGIGDYVTPDGNTNPGARYKFYPELTYDGSTYGAYSSTNSTKTILTAKDAIYWATIPTDCLDESYKTYKVYVDGWGVQWINEIEMYAADSDYVEDYKLDSEN